MERRVGVQCRCRRRTGSTAPGAVAVGPSPAGADRGAVCVRGRVLRSVAGERSRLVSEHELASTPGRQPTFISAYRGTESGGPAEAVGMAVGSVSQYKTLLWCFVVFSLRWYLGT